MFSVHHVSISVSDLSKSLAFYNVFGFKEVYRWESPKKDLFIVHMRLGDVFLELFCFKKHKRAPKSTKQLETDLPVLGIKHFALKVNNIDVVKNNLKDKEIASDIEVKRGRTDVDYFFVKDPDGLFIEIVQDRRGF